MKKLIAILATIFSITAFAKENVSFSYSGFSGGNQSFYACSYVEDQTEYFLEQFGATGIEVYCSGGIQPWGSAFPVSVRAKFDLPVVTNSGVETVELEGDTWNPSCGLNTTIINTLLKKFTNIEVVKKNDSCAFATTNYYYKLNITK